MHQTRSLPIVTVSVAVVVIALTGATAFAQGVSKVGKSSTEGTESYTAPRAPDGHADISGVWANDAATPLQRPLELEGRAELTDAEVAALERMAAELFATGDGDFGDNVYNDTLKNVLGTAKGFTTHCGAAGGADREVGAKATGNYNSFWLSNRWFEKRTSLITDPPDGRLPPLTAEAQQRQRAAAEHQKLHGTDSAQDHNVSARCISGNVANPFAGYNSNYQIVQTPSHVAINMEMRHDTRIIPISNRPHLPSAISLWLGDPIGRWEGDTLVVESTNFRAGSLYMVMNLATENVRIVERFTRVAADTLKYEVTVNDPATWTRPWTMVMFWKKSNAQLYEYACHEGNYAMTGILSGARAAEREAAEKAASDGKTSGSR